MDQNSLAVVHDSQRKSMLRAACESALNEASASSHLGTSIEVTKVFTTWEGEETLVGIAKSQEELDEMVEWATNQDLLIHVVKETIHEEVFEDEKVVDAARAEILRIRKSWDAGRGTEASAIKMVAAHFNQASVLVSLGKALRIKRNAGANWDDLARLRSDIQDSEIDVGVKLIRDRIRDLSDLFGSCSNLDSFRQALETYRSRLAAGNYNGRCLTEDALDQRSRVVWLDESILLKLLVKNIGKELVSFQRRNPLTGALERFQTVISPEQLAELIALKLVLKIRHQAIRVPEVTELEESARRLASWLQHRTDRPFMGEGFLNPNQLRLHPKDREINRDPDSDLDDEADLKALGVRKILESGKMVDILGTKEAKTWVEEVEREVVIAERKDHEPTTKIIKDKVVKSNVVEFDVPKLPMRDPDLLVSPASPRLFNDRRRPLGPNGKVQVTYSGPSFVRFEKDKSGRVIPVSAGPCQMHGSSCSHCHVTKLMLNPKVWAPRLRLTRVIEGEVEGETLEVNTTVSARKDFMRIGKFIDQWGRSREKLEFNEEGMYMPLLVPKFRDFILNCLWTGTFRAPPILEVTKKLGILTGGLLREKNRLVAQLKVLGELGEDVSDITSRLAELEEMRRSYDQRFATLHVFIPMNPTLFDIRRLPSGWRDMGIRVQVKGRFSDLRWLAESNSGAMVITTWLDTRPTWTFSRREWKWF